MQCWAAESQENPNRTLTLFFERQLALLIVVLVLAPTSILASLYTECSQSSNIRLQECNEVGGGVVGLPSGLFRRTFPLFLGILTYFQVSSLGVVVPIFVPIVFRRGRVRC